jgi:hypothetical protein
MSTGAVAFESALLLLSLWIFVFVFWGDYRLDAFRDHVFSIRQKLFMYAANGYIAFDHPAYTMLRYRMNVVLRYGHEFTLLRVLLVVSRIGTTGPPPDTFDDLARWEQSLSGLPSDVQGVLRGFSTTLGAAMLQLMIYRSFFLYLLLRPFMPTTELVEVVRKKSIVESSVERIESETLEEAGPDPRGKDLVAVP